MTVEFELDGQPFTALNGGPIFAFSEATSLQLYCRDQAEVYYWGKPTPGETNALRPAAGSGTGSGFPGRSCPAAWQSWSATAGPRNRSGQWPRCFR